MQFSITAPGIPVPGIPGVDEPVVWYEGAGTADRRFLQADERGSIVSVSNASGASLAINAYDEYGIPAAGNSGRYQYTGQIWLGEIGLYHYKARMYSPTLGRFMQTDPIGYGDGMNWYNYAHSDAVNASDPSGTKVPAPACTGSLFACGDGGFGSGASPGTVIGGFWQPTGQGGSSFEPAAGNGSGPIISVISSFRWVPNVNWGSRAFSLPQSGSPICRSKPLGNSPVSGGLYAQADAAAGFVALGAAGEVGVAAMAMDSRELGFTKTTGGFVGGPYSGGTAAGAGGSLLEVGARFTNATNLSQLAGRARNLSIGVGPISISGSYSSSGVYTVDFGLDIIGTDFVSVTTYDTNTTYSSSDCP